MTLSCVVKSLHFIFNIEFEETKRHQITKERIGRECHQVCCRTPDPLPQPLIQHPPTCAQRPLAGVKH